MTRNQHRRRIKNQARAIAATRDLAVDAALLVLGSAAFFAALAFFAA